MNDADHGAHSQEPPLVAHRERLEACPECGRPLHDEPKFCPSCGRRLWSEVSGPVARTEGYAVASVACGVVGLFAAPIVGPVLAIVFGNRARDRMARDPALEGAGLARAGTTLGWVGVAISAIVLVVGIALMSSLASHAKSGDNFSTPPCPVENPWPGVRMEGCD
jgi:uncharacterized protein DUF4190